MFNRIKSVRVLAIAIATGMSAAPAAAGRHDHHHHHKGHHEEPTHVRATPEPESSTPVAPAIVAPPPQDEETTHHTSKVDHLDKEQKARQKVTSLFVDANKNISLKVKAHFQDLTNQEIEKIVKSEFRKAAENTAKQVDSGVSFEIASGKLKIGASKTIAGLNVTFGELNVYKTSTLIASSIIACKAFVSNERKGCLDNALSKAESILANEFTPETKLQAPVMHETRTAEVPTSAWLFYAVVAAIAAGIVGLVGLFFKKHRSEVGAA